MSSATITTGNNDDVPGAAAAATALAASGNDDATSTAAGASSSSSSGAINSDVGCGGSPSNVATATIGTTPDFTIQIRDKVSQPSKLFGESFSPCNTKPPFLFARSSRRPANSPPHRIFIFSVTAVHACIRYARLERYGSAVQGQADVDVPSNVRRVRETDGRRFQLLEVDVEFEENLSLSDPRQARDETRKGAYRQRRSGTAALAGVDRRRHLLLQRRWQL